MKRLYSPLVFTIIMISYSAINTEGVFGASGKIIDLIMYLVMFITTITSIILTLTLLLNKKLEDKYVLVFLFLVLYFAFLIFSSVVNENITSTILMKNLFALGLYLYILIGTVNIEKLINSLFLFLSIILLLNLFYYFFIPNIGVYTYNENGFALLKGILTNRNSVIYYSLPLLILTILNVNLRKATQVVLILLTIFSIIVTGSDTALISVFFFLIIIALYRKKRFNPYFYVSLLIVFNIVIVMKETSFVKYFLEEIIGSDSAFSGRDLIWANSLSLLDFHSLLIGKGLGSNAIAKSLNYATATNGEYLNDTFNGILNLLFFNGTIILVSFLLFFLLVVKRLYNNQDVLYGKYFSIYLIVILLISNSESVFQFTNYIFWTFLLISWSLGKKGTLKKGEIYES